MESATTFFVGIGAQRSGTTWIAKAFEDHPEIGMSPIKETHFWTSKHVAHQRGAVRGLQAAKLRIPKLLSRCRQDPLKAPSWLMAYAGMMAHRDKSYRRFIELGRGSCTVAGEITPAYATLSEDAFKSLDDCIDQPKYFLVLRNPADRLVSQIAHTKDIDPAIEQMDLQALLALPYFSMRSDYAATYQTCVKVSGPERLHVLFYEDLFDQQTAQATLDKLYAYIGVSSRHREITEVINARPAPRVDISRRELVQSLRKDYQFFNELFEDALPQRWKQDIDHFLTCDGAQEAEVKEG
ncbi:MAG: sulfotransferase domain-containing protein [Pseudomonadota bacterium]